MTYFPNPLDSKESNPIRTLGGTLEREIELNRIIGEMAGTLNGITMLYKDQISKHSLDQIERLLKRYDDFFKGDE